MSANGFFDQGELVAVLTTQPLDRTLDYKAPEGGCFLGAFVEVPLGPRKVLGVVWGAGRGDWDPAKIRSVLKVLDVAPMRAEMRQAKKPKNKFRFYHVDDTLTLAPEPYLEFVAIGHSFQDVDLDVERRTRRK